MIEEKNSPCSQETRGISKKVLVEVTRPMILTILKKFSEEVKEAKDISPFLDRIMEDLDRPGQDGGAIAFDPQARAGERFSVENEKDDGLWQSLASELRDFNLGRGGE